MIMELDYSRISQAKTKAACPAGQSQFIKYTCCITNVLQRPAQVKSMCRKAYMSRANITKTVQLTPKQPRRLCPLTQSALGTTSLPITKYCLQFVCCRRIQLNKRTRTYCFGWFKKQDSEVIPKFQMFEESRKCHRAALRGQSAHRTKHTITETGKKYPGDTANIHCAADTHTYHTLIHYQRGKNTERLTCTNNTHTHTVHYNETVDGRPPCRDPNSCSALRADYVQGQGETGSKQSQSPKIHTHTQSHTSPPHFHKHSCTILCKCRDTHIRHNVANQ